MNIKNVLDLILMHYREDDSIEQQRKKLIIYYLLQNKGILMKKIK